MEDADKVAAKAAEIREKQAKDQGLLLELEQGAKLKALGIIRDGTQHFVPADLLKWRT